MKTVNWKFYGRDVSSESEGDGSQRIVLKADGAVVGYFSSPASKDIGISPGANGGMAFVTKGASQ